MSVRNVEIDLNASGLIRYALIFSSQISTQIVALNYIIYIHNIQILLLLLTSHTCYFRSLHNPKHQIFTSILVVEDQERTFVSFRMF
ncbi:hypothetical protein QVD17_25945 [Tagetes erecta]|uniref:Uncharacterized protein n=1 Tax=Tagetes erecta TaxID=13708 RepID=A0AAD8K802_TARER|nr:hypothetical protein QVD17_25945 [Tagetes erecta]